MDDSQPLASESRTSLREVLSRVPTAVTVITTADGDGPHGTTVSAFCSLSADPPLVLVALDRDSNLLGKLRATRHFAVNVLACGQDEIARRCAQKTANKLRLLCSPGPGEAPLIAGAAGWLRCTVEQLVPGGDHEIVIGRVLACEAADREPLVYHRRSYARLADMPG